MVKKPTIKCSQCDATFSHGYEYRIHWEKHLDEFIEKEKRKNEKMEDI
tara:strand:- start:174 stop:317 length:144 start_codon:yes stop_codon:yes gene_type:complete